jgi:hypothetical protein
MIEETILIASFSAIALMRIVSDRGPFGAPDGLPDRPGRKGIEHCFPLFFTMASSLTLRNDHRQDHAEAAGRAQDAHHLLAGHI